MKKLVLTVTALMFISAAAFLSCKKDAIKKEPQKMHSSTIKDKLSRTDDLEMSMETTLMTNPAMLSMVSCSPTIQEWLSSLSPEALEVVFEDYPFLRGYVINFNTQLNGYDVSVLAVRDDSTGEEFTLIRKVKGTITNNEFTGELVFMDPSGVEILHNTYVDGERTVEVSGMDSWQDNTTITVCNAPTPDLYFGHCTRAQFNAAYKKAKSECEADWACDFACSFHPCCISYLASAMIDCW